MTKETKSDKKKKKKKTALSADTKRSIVAVVCFAVALISVLSFFSLAGVFGQSFLKITSLLFGKGVFLVPFSLVLAGLALLMPHRFSPRGLEKRKHIYAYTFLGVGLFIISILSLFHIFASAGGYIGMILGYTTEKLLGFWGSLVIFLSLLVISVLVTFNISLKQKKKEELEEEKEQEKILGQEELSEEKLSFWQKIKKMAGKKEAQVTISTASQTTESKTDELKEKVKATIGAVSLMPQPKNLKKKKLTNVKLPPLDLLEGDKGQPTSGDIKANLNIIKRTFENFGIEVEMAEVNVGPTVTQYTLRPAYGVKLARIISLQNDLSLALAAHPIRIEAPIPGRSLVGIEIPNKSVMMVRLRNLMDNTILKEADSTLTLALGRNVAGQPIYADLAKMPHMLIAGATGTGKTIAINGIISSLLYQNSIETLRLILIDPKRVEFPTYNDIPHLLTPVIVQNNKAVNALRWALGEMDRRFNTLQEKGARDIHAYNNRSDEHMPYIVIVIDELADIMASCGREVEACIVRLAQMARAVGIHLVVATQRPSVDVITGLIKANITTRMAFQVASQIDSRTILDMAGAEKLLGNGDLLYLSAAAAKPKRLQGTFISDKETKRLAEYWRNTLAVEYDDTVVDSSSITLVGDKSMGSSRENGDELYEEAKDVILKAGKASASLLQRRLRVGYARAARLLDILEEDNIIGPADGARPRDVLISTATVQSQEEQDNTNNIKEE